MGQTPSEHGSPELVFDDFAWKLAGCLLEDFKPFMPSDFHDAAVSAQAERNVEKWRMLACGDSELKPYHMKTTRQVLDLFKKFSFSQDLYTPAQLIENSKKKFLDNQQRLSNFRLSDDPLVKAVIFGARGYVDQILGDFSSLEICERATFGKKSSVGIPMRNACEGARYEAPITGSRDHIDWFDKYFGAWNRPAHRYAQARAVLREKPPYHEISSLEAVLVDKTWKSLRMIMPNTTLGTLYSSGLGRTFEDRLRSAGYDIKHLQPVHGELARFGSLTGSLVTADQSMASDNITVQLVDAVFPRRWASALKFGRIEEMALYGETLVTPTFATMGIGFTFPLQTLLFLCLLLSIRDYLLLDEQVCISVFGDDLIYDERMHDTVEQVFPLLGLVLNADKTFATGHFRESCGFDYYHGIDVRPFHLGRATGLSVGKRRAESYLYTAANALMRRWSWYEVPSASQFIVGEIRRIRKGADPLVVPTDYPDTAGVKANFELAADLGINFVPVRDVHGVFSFRYLAFEPEPRAESRHVPYMIQALRSPSQVVNLASLSLKCLTTLPRGVGDMLHEKPNIFKWVDDREARTIRSMMNGKRLRPKLATIPEQDRGRYRERPGVTSNWTPEHKTKAHKA